MVPWRNDILDASNPAALPSNGSQTRPEAAFATTHWSVVLLAGMNHSPEADAALERLCRSYWYPLYSFVRKKGYAHEDACDLTQAFFARLLEKRSLQAADATRGRFRTFLLTALSHFLTNEWGKSRAQRRGNGQPSLSLNVDSAEERFRHEPLTLTTPEKLFERRWAQTLLASALDRLATEMDAQRFQILKGFILDDNSPLSYEDASRQLQLSVPAVTSAIHRMRLRFRALVHQEIADTVHDPAEIKSELHFLLAALTD